MKATMTDSEIALIAEKLLGRKVPANSVAQARRRLGIESAIGRGERHDIEKKIVVNRGAGYGPRIGDAAMIKWARSGYERVGENVYDEQKGIYIQREKYVPRERGLGLRKYQPILETAENRR